MNRLKEAIATLEQVMADENVNPRDGLPEDLFIFATTLIPCPNVDLLVTRGNSVLLTWRDDVYYGCGWHIPGGCLRMTETIEHRIQETAKSEIGIEVSFDRDGFITREAIIRYNRQNLCNQLQRAHNISMLFNCKLPADFIIENNGLRENDAGYKKWFNHMPDNLLVLQKELYGDILMKCFTNLGGNNND